MHGEGRTTNGEERPVMADPECAESPSPRFPTTHWSRIVAAQGPAAPEARDALVALCTDYWYPIYSFIRRRGYRPDQAADLTQDFFARLLEPGAFAAASPRIGRFRSFLRGACSHFLSNYRDREKALKRGGGCHLIPIDRLEAEGRFGREPAHELTAERAFERKWALTLLDRALHRLDLELVRSRNRPLLERLRPLVFGEDGARSYREIAGEVGVSESAAKMAAHRLRERYRELLREEVARTVADASEIESEITALLTSLAD
jgi:RNA polymerase sigma-70 factor (ECF subfamily)